MGNELTPSERRRILGNMRTVLELVPRKGLCLLLQMLDGEIEITASSVNRFTGISGEALDSIILLFADRKIQKDIVAVGLHAALDAEEHARNEAETIDMSWTGPVQFSVEGRSNVSVIEEMISDARDTVTIVGYSLTDGAGRIIDLLEAAARRNVDVVFVIHNDEKSDNVGTLKKGWKYWKKPKVYTRLAMEADAYFKIHAKMIVVDSRDILITSANLTWHGMSNNFELGLRVRGKTAKKGQVLISDLIRRKYLTEVESW